MTLFRILVLATFAWLAGCVSFASIEPPKTPVREYTQTDIPELLASGKHAVLRSRYRGRSLDGFRGKEIAKNEVLHAAANEGKHAIYIDHIGRSQESWGGGSGLHDIVEASSVDLVDATEANIGETLTQLDGVHAVEAKSALHLIESQKMTALAPKLLEYVKSQTAGTYFPEAIALYASLQGEAAHDEVLKVLKFHADPDARLAAGSALIRLGDRGAVETALAEEQSPEVSQALKQLLLQS